MVRHRPNRSRRPRPTTPSGHTTTQPSSHSSPTSQHSWPDQREPSEPGSLDDSFLLVDTDDEERDHVSALGRARDDDETSSTVGSSLGDSILDGILSDTSSAEPVSAGELEPDDWEEADQSTGTVEGPPPTVSSLLGGSYVDADASTEQSPMDTSENLDSTASSQVRLVLPDPGSSFLTSSDGTTPSGSHANLSRVPHVANVPRQGPQDASHRRTVTQDWLDASSKLWDYVPHTADAHSSILGSSRNEDALREITFDNIRTVDEGTPYAILGSHDSIDDRPSLVEKGRKDTIGATPKNIGEKAAYSPSVKLSPKVNGRLAPSTRSVTIKEAAKKWSLRMSAVAIASVLSILAYRSLGLSGVELQPLNSPSDATQPTPSVLPGGRTSASWGNAGPIREASTTASGSLATQRFPDLQVIKHALSTFSGEIKSPATEQPITTGKVSHVIYADPPPNGHKRIVSSPCASCSLSIRDSNTAVSVRSPGPAALSLATSWRDRIGRSSRSNVVNASTPTSASANWSYQQAVADRIQRTVEPIHVMAYQVASILGSIYAPAVAEFWREFDELLALVRVIAETSSTFVEFVVKRTGRGLTVSRQLLQSAGHRLRVNMPSPASFANSTAGHANILQARRGLDRLSSYVEYQSVAMTEMFEEQAEAARERMLDSVKQARCGLDRLVEDVSSALGREDVQSGKVLGDPLPRRMPRGARERRSGCDHGQKKQKRSCAKRQWQRGKEADAYGEGCSTSWRRCGAGLWK